jgi:two-component system, NtrC family, sensor kinase
VTIEVQDSGAGVPVALRPRLFEPFFTTAKAGEGTGLGLAISAGLVVRMGGALELVTSEPAPSLHPNGSPGAMFRVTLRAASGATFPASAANPSERPAVEAPRPRPSS